MIDSALLTIMEGQETQWQKTTTTKKTKHKSKNLFLPVANENSYRNRLVGLTLAVCLPFGKSLCTFE